jgi:N-methylhydantoinase B
MSTIQQPQMTKGEREHRAFWDGTAHSYIPADVLRVPDGLRIFTDAETEIDPITFEVIRHSLWNANEEHGEIVTNLAVSPITLETRDFQTAIITGDGEILFFGPYLQYLAGFMDMVAKFIVETRGADIRPGDMWLVNDPWIGTAHQPDVNLMCPVFTDDGQLFCWVANNVHQNDIGGTVPGSFCPNAVDIFWDPVCIPPIRIVRDKQIDRDVEAFYRRQSRTPINLALDLRACIAGNNAAEARILGLIDRYGARTVRGVMNRLLDSSQASFREILQTIPDGEWSERCYQEVAVSGERGAHRIEMHMHKTGDRLTFTNDGTAAEVGAINLPFAAQRGTTLAAINVLMVPEHLGVIGGAARQIDYEPSSGTITCPDYGVAVSPAGIYATELNIAMANAVVTKMLLCSRDESVRARVLATTPAQWHLHIHAGTNQRGVYYVGPMLDAIIGTTGATATADGTFANGVWWIPEGRGPNVESYERDWPILYLYRREDSGSGGAGRFRGGNGGRLAYIPHNGEVGVGVYTSEGVPKTMGILGGVPGSTGETLLLDGSDVREAFARGELPGSLDELNGTRRRPFGKGDALPVAESTVIEWNWGGAAGYGDPITRAPAAVATDVAHGTIPAASAEREYGVVLDESGAVDSAATTTRRTQIRHERLRAAGIEREPRAIDGSGSRPAGGLLIGSDIAVDEAARTFACAHCGEPTGSFATHALARALAVDVPVQSLGERFTDPAYFIDDPIVWRHLYCPGCATRFGGQVARPDDEPLAEFKFAE